jgi:benzoylformate decarboxylase
MEELSTVGIAAPSVIDRRMVAGSLEALAARLAAVTPGRLLIIAGDEVYSSDAAAEVVALAEALGAPVYGSSWPSCLPFPTAHPLWAGNMPSVGKEIFDTISRYDAVFALGGKSLITILYAAGPIIPEGCLVYQLSADVRDLGRTYSTQLSVVGDIKATLAAMQPALAAAVQGRAPSYEALLRAAAQAQVERRARLAERTASQWGAPVITPLVAAQEVARAIGPDIRIVDEAIATALHVRSFLNSRSASQYSFLRGGALGWGMPAAVGCSLGIGREPVVSLVGDGAAMYSPQAIWTAAHEKLPVTFIVMNNREYNVLKNFLKKQSDYLSTRSNRFIAMDITDPPIDFLAMAASMGIPARRIERAGDIAPAVEAGIASGVANLIEIVISAE